jgi:transposase
LLPRLGGEPRVDDRRIISGILHRFREGLRWRALPDEYGPRTTVFNRFNRWSKRGLWQELFVAVAACGDPPAQAVADSTAVRAPLDGGRQRGEQNQAIGRSQRRSTPSAMNSAGSMPCS